MKKQDYKKYIAFNIADKKTFHSDSIYELKIDIEHSYSRSSQKSGVKAHYDWQEKIMTIGQDEYVIYIKGNK